MPKVKSQDGVSVHYEIHDYTDPWLHPPTLILQHGFGRTARYWYHMIPYLARQCRVVCPTLRGLGKSDSDFDMERGLTLDNYLADLNAIVDDLGVESVHYAGESIGGILGFAFAARHPVRVRSLTTLTAPLFITQEVQKAFAFGHPSWAEAITTLGVYEWCKKANSATRFPAGADARLVDWYASESGMNRVEAMAGMARFASKANVTDLLEHIQAPVLGLYPTGGKLTTNEQVDTIKAKIRDFRIIHLPTPYHMVWVLYPSVCAKHIGHFIATQEGIACPE